MTEYDIFEVLPDRNVIWRACTRSLEDANIMLVNLSKQSTNEFFAIHLHTNEIVARMNYASHSSGPACTESNVS